MADILIPEEYKKDCVPLYSRYGAFLQRYNLHTLVKKSKIQSLVDNKTVSFPGMTKYSFLMDYLQKEDYTIDDFIGIRDPSLRGFLYEAIWDLYIKCNIVPELRQPEYQHVQGKIEHLGNALKHPPKMIHDISFYLKNTKLQSGSTGGVSDITLRKKDHFMLISSKFYIAEKTLDKYDIESLYHAISSTKHTFDIILLVHHKAPFRTKRIISKEHLKDNIYALYDILDAGIYLLQLRKLVRITTQHGGELETYLNDLQRKPLYIPSLHVHRIMYMIESWFLKNTLHEKIIVSEMKQFLYDVWMSLVDNKTGRRIHVVCDALHQNALEEQMKRYLRTPTTVTFTQEIVPHDSDITIYVTSSKEKLQHIRLHKYYHANSATSLVLYNAHTPIFDVSGPCILSYHYRDLKNWKDLWAENNNTIFPSDFALENAIRSYYGTTAYQTDKYILRKDVYDNIQQIYRSYPDVYGSHLLGRSIPELLSHLFGTKQNHQGPSILYNILRKKRLFQGKLVWVADSRMQLQIQTEIEKNTFYKERIKHHGIEMEYTGTLSTIPSSLPNIVICLLEVPIELIHSIIEPIFSTIHQRNIKQQDSPTHHLVWIDIHPPNIACFSTL